jgi:predicted O-linked N-acetylglucosamine transferase (SPINDLY family)
MACSILSELGLSGLIAVDADEYIRIAAELAADVPQLDELRRSLRQKLERSPMRNFPGFTKGLESAYRSMWRNWCAAQRGRAGVKSPHAT